MPEKLSPPLKKLARRARITLRLMSVARWWWRLRGRNETEEIEMIDLEAPIQRAVALYGEPKECNLDREFRGVVNYVFSVGKLHHGIIDAWKGRIHSVTYFSVYDDAERDLNAMAVRYGEGQEWTTPWEGLLYRRADGKLWLWWAIGGGGVATAEFKNAQAALKGGTFEE